MRKFSKNNKVKIYMITLSIFILFITCGIRAFNMYDRYQAVNKEFHIMDEQLEENKKRILESVFEQGYENARLNTKNLAFVLQTSLLEEFSYEEIMDVLFNGNLNEEMYLTFSKTFNLDNNDYKTVYVVGTKNGVIYTNANTHLDKFAHFSESENYMISWEEFYNHLEQPEITQQAFSDLASGKVDYVILRLDENYSNGTYCTIDDVIDDYIKNGTKNMDNYCVLTLGLITEDGDMFGEKDEYYMIENPNVNKIYVYRTISLDSFIDKQIHLIDDTTGDYENIVSDLNHRLHLETAQTLLVVTMMVIVIFILLVILKDILDEEEELENKHITNDSNEEKK